MLIGCGGTRRNVLLEVKAEKGLLRATQAAWRSRWRGEVYTVRTVAEALSALDGQRHDPRTMLLEIAMMEPIRFVPLLKPARTKKRPG